MGLFMCVAFITRYRAMQTGDEEDWQEAWSAVWKGSVFPCAVVLGWERGIFHRPGLLQVLLALPAAFAWGKAAPPAHPEGRTGAISEQLFMLDQAGLCCQSPCPAPRQGPLRGQHFLLISCILGSCGHVCSLEGEVSSQSPLIPCPVAGSCVHGGRVGAWDWLYI